VTILHSSRPMRGDQELREKKWNLPGWCEKSSSRMKGRLERKQQALSGLLGHHTEVGLLEDEYSHRKLNLASLSSGDKVAMKIVLWVLDFVDLNVERISLVGIHTRFQSGNVGVPVYRDVISTCSTRPRERSVSGFPHVAPACSANPLFWNTSAPICVISLCDVSFDWLSSGVEYHQQDGEKSQQRTRDHP
jgi:hypothetical protein